MLNFGEDEKYFCVLFASIAPKLEPSFKCLVMLIYLWALKTGEGIFFFSLKRVTKLRISLSSRKKQNMNVDVTS